ncbi:S4 domain-containing protein [Sphingomonas sp. LR61]|uniref:S4 domain-containing protein n=1 Tax=Sphingomonas sp. LR61 TaxID=3050234 RepID=UPI003FA6F24F
MAQALVETELVKSLGEARRAIDQGGVYVNNVRAEDATAPLSDLALPGESSCSAAARRPSPA